MIGSSTPFRPPPDTGWYPASSIRSEQFPTKHRCLFVGIANRRAWNLGSPLISTVPARPQVPFRARVGKPRHKKIGNQLHFNCKTICILLQGYYSTINGFFTQK